MSLEDRLVEFVAGLRAAGARVSVAESTDGLRAIEAIGITDRESFRFALRTTLVKESPDVATFDRLFPMYFSAAAPPMMPATSGMGEEQQQELADALDSLPKELADLLRRLLDGEQLTKEELEALRKSLQAAQASPGQQGDMSEQQMQELMNRLGEALRSRLAQLMHWLLSGQGPTQEQLEQIGQEVGLQRASHPLQQRSLSERMMRAMGMQQLEELMEKLMEQLAEAGVGEETASQISETVQANADALGEQVNEFVGASIARQVAQQQPPPVSMSDLMQRPFQSLSEQEAHELRNELRRLAARLRSRASLRYRKGKTGLLDPKATIRRNLRFGGVPFDVRHRRRRVRPKLVLICDISTSMRPVVEFLLTLIYELQDQVTKTRSFAFIDDIQEITQDFAESRPQVAIQQVLDRMPPGYYNTDLGFSLNTFTREHFDAVDNRTTVIVVGDGRNNFNPPHVDAVEHIRRRARRLVWFNPEPPVLWGSGDSDMDEYVAFCSAVFQVANLEQLSAAVDALLTN